MKKLTICIMTSLLLLTFMPNQLKAGVANNPIAIHSNKPSESPELKVLLTRLNEIKAIDKSKLNSTNRKQLRKEVRIIKSQLRELNSGVYISVGALLIVILLLILLL